MVLTRAYCRVSDRRHVALESSDLSVGGGKASFKVLNLLQ
jgi:hypothetical protein